jgi:serine/threonine protein kinase
VKTEMIASEEAPETIGETCQQLLTASFHSSAETRTVLQVDENHPEPTKKTTNMSTEHPKDTSVTCKESSEVIGGAETDDGAAGDERHTKSFKGTKSNPSQESPEHLEREIPEDLPKGLSKSMSKPESGREESAGEIAQRKFQEYFASSKLVKPVRRGSAEMLRWEDIELGRLLDTGSFSCVYEGTLSRDKVEPKPVYAIKYLRENVTEREDTYVTGSVDLALEASILSKLMHENVIRVHGYRSGCISQSFGEAERGFFLVMDLLFDTCDKRLDRWRRARDVSRWSMRQSPDTLRIRERIEDVAVGVANGMAYIHSRNIIYRDLKPQNIGFNEAGEVKIFDFGLARETDSLGNLRQMTGNAGTPRYMSPEIARNEHYGFASDVYSFSILLWEIVTLDKPFDSIKSLPQFNDEVVRRHHRPPLKKVHSLGLRTLLQQCWHRDQNQRPTFKQVQQVLVEYLVQTEPKSPVFRRYLSPLSGRGGGRESSVHERLSDSTGVQTQPTSSLMSSAHTDELIQDAESRSSRLRSCFPWLHRERYASEPPVVESHIYKKSTWVQRKLLRKPTMRLDLSTREYRIRKYDLGRPGSFRSSGSVHSSNEFKQSRRMSGGSAASRRSSGKGDSNIEAMAAVLAAERKSNRQFLREMKRADKKGEKNKGRTSHESSNSFS